MKLLQDVKEETYPPASDSYFSNQSNDIDTTQKEDDEMGLFYDQTQDTLYEIESE